MHSRPDVPRDEAFRRIYLLRHAETLPSGSDGRAEGITDSGQTQVAALGRLFAEVALDAVYTSPAGRAVDTARAIAAATGASVTVEDALVELRGGDVGRGDLAVRVDAIHAFYSDFDVDWDRPALGDGGETIRQLRGRVLPFLAAVVGRPGWRRAAVVGHMGTNRVIIGHVIGHAGPGWPRVDQDFGCVNVIDVFGDTPVLRVLNFTVDDPLKASREASALDIWRAHMLQSHGLAEPQRREGPDRAGR